MNKKKIDLTRILEIASVLMIAAVAVISIISALKNVILDFADGYFISVISSLFEDVRGFVIAVNLLITRCSGILGFVIVILPLLAVGAVIVTGKHRFPEKKKLLTGAVIISAIGEIIVLLLSLVNKVLMSIFIIGFDKLYVRSAVSELFCALLFLAAVFLVIDGLHRIIKWNNPIVLMIAEWAMIVLYTVISGFQLSGTFLFLILFSTFLREDMGVRPVPAIVGNIGAFVSLGMILVNYAVDFVFNTVQRIFFARGDETIMTIWNIFDVMLGIIAFIAFLTIPLILLGRNIPSTEEK